MYTRYNEIAGHSLERLAALSDGVFAVAMTLLVLDLRTPAVESIHAEADLWHALLALSPRLLVYMLSFLTLGIFWVGQQTHLNQFVRSDRDLTWINLAFLFVVSLLPFSTSLMGQFIAYRLALLEYWLNILLFGLVLLAGWRYAERAGLLRPEVPEDLRSGVVRRIVLAQTLYGFGALLCVFSTYVSLCFIILVQLIYALAPPVLGLRRL
jgi:uncharacterized membrane protein